MQRRQKRIQILNENVKLFLPTDDVILYVEYPREWTTTTTTTTFKKATNSTKLEVTKSKQIIYTSKHSQ